MSEAPEHNLTSLPGGTVTFLFTDIEGSTRLLDQLRDQYAALLAAHHQIIREALEQWGGREVDTQGDAFFAAFPKATEAVAAVAQIQRLLAEHSWPEGVQVRVRMGLHTGEPWLVEEGYVGMDVHRAARIGHVGYGGQVLLSESTTALVQDELPEGVTLLDLGRHRLKDMRRPEPIQQLLIEGLPSEFPPLKSLEALPAMQVGPPDDGQARTPRQVGDSPYRGLAAFQESDAELFFGREAFTEQLALAVGEQQLVAVIIGPSGAGKSSAVFAGLLPQLREEGNWLIVEMRPGARPFHALAGALIPSLEDDLTKTDRLIETRKLAQAIRRGELSLFQVAELALSQRDDADRLLLVIDQFEQIFTLRPDPEIQQLFLDELLAAAEAGTGFRRAPLVLLLTLRADFMGQALGHRPFTDALQEGSLILGPMNREELQAAVEKPAELAGGAFEPGLVQRILDDIGQEPGNLPLLEFALTLLWERLEEGWMTHAAYDEIGRVDGALARYAEEVWAELDEAEREGARPLFVQLVQPGEGTEDTRRVARRSELPPGLWSLVQHLADRRLVVTGQDEAGDETVEVVHEALIRGWERLRAWMMEDRAFRTWQEGLRVALRGWESSGRDEGSLLRAAPLALALERAEEHQAELSAKEAEYIEASRQFDEIRAAEEEARRQRELETAQKLAETEHARAEEQERAASGLRQRAYILGGVLVIAVLLAIAAFFFARQSSDNAAEAQANAQLAATREAEAVTEANQRATAQAQAEIESQRADAERDAALSAQATAVAEGIRADEQRDAALAAEAEAEEQTQLSTSREIALAALNNLDTDPELSILLALEALNVRPTNEAQEALHRALQESRVRIKVSPYEANSIIGAAFSPDGTRFVTTDTAGTAIVWDAETGEELVRFAGHAEDGTDRYDSNWVNSPDFTPDGQKVATGGEDGTVRLWDPQTGEELLAIEAHEDGASVDAVDFSADGSKLLTGGWDNTAKIWDAETGEQLLAIEAGHSEEEKGGGFTGVVAAGFSPDGRRFATSGVGGLAIVWDAESGEELMRLDGHYDFVHDVAFSPDGSLIATASTDNTAMVWDAETGELIATLSGHSNELRKLAFGPDSQRLATASVDGTAKIWELESGRELLTLAGHDHRVYDIAFSPDGSQVLTTSRDRTARVWDVEEGQKERLTFFINAHEGRYSPDGQIVITTDDEGVVKFWDAASGDYLKQFEGTDWSGGAELSPDGTILAGVFDDGTAIVWDAQSGESLYTLAGHEDWANNLAISQDGSLLATVGQDGKVVIWDLNSGQEMMTLDHGGPAWGVDFTFDGAFLVSAGSDQQDDVGTAFLWDLANGERVQAFEGHESRAKRSLFSPDGTKLLTAGWDGTARLWDVASGEELFLLGDHSGNVWGADYSPDGRMVATGSNDGSVKLWDADTGVVLLTLVEGPDSINSVSFSPDGTTLIAAFNDGTLREYILPLDELVELAHTRLTRTLTDEECRQYLHLDACPID